MLIRLLGFAAILLSGFLGAWTLLIWYTVRMLIGPPRRTYAWALARHMPGDPSEATPPRDFRAFTFTSRNRVLAAWDIAADCSTGPIIIMTPGWGESRITMLHRAGEIAQSARRIILWDPPGHGDSPGNSSLGAYECEDLLALCDAVTGQDLVLYGYSLGAGVSIEAVARSRNSRIRGIIAEAPYRVPIIPARNVLDQLGAPCGISLDLALMIVGLYIGYGLDFATSKLYDRVSHAAKLKLPLLVLHGEVDTICPPSDGQAIAHAGSGHFVAFPGANHINIWHLDSSRAAAQSAVRSFCREALCIRTIDDANAVE